MGGGGGGGGTLIKLIMRGGWIHPSPFEQSRHCRVDARACRKNILGAVHATRHRPPPPRCRVASRRRSPCIPDVRSFEAARMLGVSSAPAKSSSGPFVTLVRMHTNRANSQSPYWASTCGRRTCGIFFHSTGVGTCACCVLCHIQRDVGFSQLRFGHVAKNRQRVGDRTIAKRYKILLL